MKKNQVILIFSLFLLLFSCKKDGEVVEIVPEPGTVPFIMTISTWWDNANVYFYVKDRDYSYDYTIDWGDGAKETNLTARPSHEYLKKGTYKISITGVFPSLVIPTTQWDDKEYDLVQINQWGNIEWKDFEYAFQASPELIYSATDKPILKNVTSTRSMFQTAKSFNGDINDWDVSRVTDMRAMFKDATSFNKDLNKWDVRKVTLMNDMFKGAVAFNGNIADWDLRNLKNTEYMFSGATNFNSDIGKWNVDNVAWMEGMFEGATSFNQDIGNWDVTRALRMERMFEGATSFNQDISNWNVS